MAFTNSPQQDTYSTHEFPIVKELGSRGTSTSKDSYITNFYVKIHQHELTGDKYVWLVKRDGSTQFIAAAGATGQVRGIYHWEDQEKLYVAIEDDIYVYHSTDGSLQATLTSVWTSTTGNVGFTEFLYDTGITKVVAVDGTRLVTIDSANTVVTSASANLPNHEPTPIYIDGYLCLLKTSTADMYNSDLNDPTAWTAGNFITGEMLPDQAQKISRLNNYVLMFGHRSIEYFYDAAIASGSPFQRNDAYVKYTGYIGGLASYSSVIFFVGSNNDSQPDVFVLSNSDMKPVGSQAVRMHLASLTSLDSSITGNVVSIDGNDFYVLDTGVATYAMNLKTLLWTTWIYQNGTRFAMNNSVNPVTSTAYHSLFTLKNDRAVYAFSSSLYQDNGTNFTCTAVTDVEDFGTHNQKSMSRLSIVADKPSASTSVAVSWTDDDYQTYNTPINVDLYQEFPSLRRLGRFRRRALKLTHTDNYPIRIKRIEVSIDKGVS